jgi:molecular chaperone DnaK
VVAGPTLGIDLGTTFSVVATIDDHGAPQVLRNPLGEETTPSVVCFESPTSVLVGTLARNAAPVYPDLTAALVKRRMGSERLYAFHGVEYTPESISALILRALVDGAVPRRDPSRPVPAVITVPAYFGIREREATQQAAIMAGLEVLELVSEPVAAAIHYGFSEAVGIGTALVYDLGGGTFDSTVLTMGGRIDVVATDGDVELGGADWDDRLTSHLARRFVVEARPEEDPLDDDEFMAELAHIAERAKRELSVASSQRLQLRWRGQSVVVTLTRDDFEAMTRDLLDRTTVIVDRLLAAAKAKGVGVIDHCLLIGGSSKMPAVAAALRSRYGWSPRSYDPDLAVAKGAALRAHQLLPLSVAGQGTRPGGSASQSGPAGRSVVGGSAPVPAQTRGGRPGGSALTASSVVSVVARGLGVLIEDSFDPNGTRQFVQHVIHQNEPLPVVARTTVATIVEDQDRARVQVYEQAGSVESDELGANRLVLDGEVGGLTVPSRAGSRLHLELRLESDGRLRLTVTEDGNGRQLNIEAFINGVVDHRSREDARGTLSRLTVKQ